MKYNSFVRQNSEITHCTSLISLDVALWNMWQVQCGICEVGLLYSQTVIELSSSFVILQGWWFVGMIIFHSFVSWLRHQMETFSALLAFCEGNLPVTCGFPSQRPVTRNFDIFFNLRPNKWLRKQSRRRWFKTPSCSLWRHCNVVLSCWFSDDYYCRGSTELNKS